MKLLHRPDLYAWSQFDEARNIDFHSLLWVRDGGNVLIDPLPMSDHDRRHLDELGGAQMIIVTNSDHVRGAEALAKSTGAQLAGPAGERDSFPIACSRWLDDGDKPFPGLAVFAMRGSKTVGELALLLDRSTLITGDLVRCHQGGRLRLLPDEKLGSKSDALASVKRLLQFREIEAVIPLDGWPIFRDGHTRLREVIGA